MTDPKPRPDSDLDDGVPALALRLHTAVPVATDHIWRQPEQLHQFAHVSTKARAILAVALEPFVDQILDILDQLPTELHPIVLSEAALVLPLNDGREAHAPDSRGGGGGR